MTQHTTLLRLRALLAAVILSGSLFVVDAAPTSLPIPRPEALTPAQALALGCADEPSFQGRLTGSKTSTTAITRTTTGNVYGYISKVVDDWSCTNAFRYDGLAWVRTNGNGYWDWGNLINSTSVACNWAIGSTDYLKGNSTTDCPDTDAEYALPIYLGANSSDDLLELVANNDSNHDDPGDFLFVHSDCTTYYGGESLKYNQDWTSGNANNRPGNNCDPRVLDGTNTTQSIVIDGTPPAFSFSTPAGTAGTIVGTTTASYQLTFAATDNVAGFGSTHPWTLQRQVAANTGGGTCDPTFSDDSGTGSWITGTANASGQTSTQTLTAGYCYRWVLSGTDMNGNPVGSTATKTSATVIVDTADPYAYFLAPQTAIGSPATITRNTTSYTISWTEVEGQSGIKTRSLQRWRVASASPTCGGTFLTDGSAVTTVSEVTQTLTGGYCYRWVQTLTDNANRTSATMSGTIFVDTTYPMATFSVPVERQVTSQATSTVTVTWTETAGSGSVTGRSLQRQKATGTIGAPGGLTWANDGSADTGASPRSSGSLPDGIYRWQQTLTNSNAKSGKSYSGWVVIDTAAPTGSISSPEANRPLAGTVTITGTATDGATFKNYTLEYGAGASPSSWTAIGTYTTPVTSTGPLATWAAAGLSGVYTLRLTVRENASTETSVATRTIVLENAMRGDESFYTRVPYDTGGGWSLDIGVANGEARLSRELTSIPSYGPAQALALSYSSAEPGTAGRFGVGWSSNLTQYLTFEAGAITTWHRADGGRVPFGNVAGTWTPPAGHFETMSVSGSEVTITTRDQTAYVFESASAGRLKRIVNRFGKALTIGWSASGATVTDASGRGPASGQTYNLLYDSTNTRVTGFIDYAGRSWTFGYTGTGAGSDLTCVTDPASKVTRLGYTSHALTSIVRGGAGCASGGASTWTIAYTGGKAVSVKSPEVSNPDQFTYAAGTATWRQVVDDTTPAYADTTYTLDAWGRATDTTQPGEPDAGPAATHLSFDPQGSVTGEITPTEGGDAEVSYEYDSRGNVTREERVLERGVGSDPDVTVVTTYTYNATNDVLTRTDADNDAATRTVTRFTYDASGHLTSENRNCTTTGTTIPAEGAGGSCTGAGTQNASTNVITSYAWTANDQLESEQDPRGFVTKHVYDTYGNETAVIANCTSSGTTPPSPFSSCTTTNGSNGGTHDAQTNVVTTTAYDAGTTAGKAGLATSTTDALGRTTAYTYDALGRQLTEVLPGDSSIPALTRTTTFDEYGNALTEAESWTPSGGSLVTRTTTHTYDLEQRETEVLDPTRQTQTVTAYDPADNAVSTTVTNAGGTATATTTTRTYYLTGYLAREVLVGAQPVAVEATYLPRGAIKTVASVDRTTSMAYFLDGAVKTRATSGSGGVVSTEATTYDSLGRELTTDDADADTTPDAINTYDRLGRLLTTTTAQRTTTYTYDRSGNQLTVTDPEGIVTTTTYDPLGRATVTIANDVASPSGSQDDITTTSYHDAAGNMVATTDARGITTRSVLNVRDQVSRTIANCTDAGTTPTSAPATCTGAGTHNNATNVITDTTYDGQGNSVKTVSAVGLSGYTATTETAYDAAGRVQASRDAMGTITRSRYNDLGQLTDTYVNCTTSGTTIPSDWANCTGQGTTSRTNGTYNLRTTYTYDAWGNQASVTGPNGRETRSVYDDDNRLAATIDNYVNGVAETADGVTDDVITEYAYDDLGRQVAVTRPNAAGTASVVTRTIFNPDGTIAQTIEACVDSPVGAPEDCTGTATPDAQTNLVTTNTYDTRGQLVQVTAPDPSASSGGAAATVKTQYAYDDAGRLCRVVENATGSTNLATLTHPCTDATQTAATATANVSTRYTYDGAGNLASMIDAAGHTTTYSYDAVGHPTGRTDALGASLVWTYDDIGNQIYQRNRTDPVLTNSVVWTHDPFGRILTRTADSATTTYTYDLNGNKLTASASGMTITATYDRLNRVLTVDDEDAGTTADTTYTYSLTSPTWTDPTGSYAATVDKFDRATALTDPASTSAWAWTYGTAGQVLAGTQGNANTLAQTFDAAGHLLTRTTKTGSTSRAAYTYAYNRAGQILSEASTITGDPANGTVAYAYDPLGQLTGSTLAGTTTAYGWDATTNRTSVQVGGGTAATTAYDAANRPTSGAYPTAAYASDADGRLTARPGQTMTWDHLGRLTAVKDAAGTTTLAATAYDPLDRLRTVDYGGSNRIRFRYTGLTTSAAQWLDDVAGTVTRSIGNGWTGERLLDWTGTSSNRRYYGTNAHHDVTWLADATGAVSASLRYDPWGTPRSTPSQGYTPFRFQGSWHDATTELSWVVTRWYAQSLGRFVSEDTLLGEPREPDSRHLYAYAAGEPVGAWDPDGMAAALRTCGNQGCEAKPDGAGRLRQFRGFWERFPGWTYSIGCYIPLWDCKKIKMPGAGYGDAMVKFMKWIVDSRRIDRSRWWSRANGAMVQAALDAWWHIDNQTHRPRMNAATSKFFRYARGPRLNGPSGLAYYGDTWRAAWDAHQAGLWRGVAWAAEVLDPEPKAEQVVIWKVLVNVESYYRLHFALDGLIDWGKSIAGYPSQYPATRRQACDMWWAGAIVATKPKVIKELCD